MTTINLYHKRIWVSDYILVIIWMISGLVLGTSFFHQYVNKIEPCKLCIWQRFLYILVFSFSPLGLAQHLNSSIRITLNIIFLAGLCLSTYHTLIQFGWLSDRCTAQSIETMEDFMRMLAQPKISCSAVSWKLFGLPATLYNALICSLALIILNAKQSLKLMGNVYGQEEDSYKKESH